jgi:hypothetical protein
VIADRRPLVAAQLAPVEAAAQRDAQCAMRSALPRCIVAHLDAEPSRKATRPRDREAVCGAAWRAGTHGPNASAAGLDTPGGAFPSHPVQTPSFFRPDATGKPLIFVTDELKDVVDIYLQGKNHKMVGQITGILLPDALATGTGGDMYVSSYNINTKLGNILVYAPPYTKGPKLTLDDSGYFPYAIAVSPAGVVAAANCVLGPSGGCGPNSGNDVAFYAKNSTRPCATIVDLPNFSTVAGATFDEKGSLYIGGQGPAPNYTPGVGEIKGGCQAKKIALLTTTSPLPYSAPLHMDKAGRIAIYDSSPGSSAQVIDAYNPPKNGSLGSPVTSTTLIAPYGIEFAFLASGRDLYFSGGVSSYTTSEYDYPAGCPLESSISNSDAAYGVAVIPPLIP